jgi:hypothetical protein
MARRAGAGFTPPWRVVETMRASAGPLFGWPRGGSSAAERRCGLQALFGAELSPRTFWTFAREFSSFTTRLCESDVYLNPGHGSARLLVRPRGPLLPGSCFQTPGPAGPSGREAVSSPWSCGRVD